MSSSSHLSVSSSSSSSSSSSAVVSRSPHTFGPPKLSSILSGVAWQSPTPYTRTPPHSPKQNDAPRSLDFTLTTSTTEASLPPRVKIICTIGPSCQSKDVLKQMLCAGMNVARLNFSHGDHTYHSSSIQILREVMSETRRILAILLDTKGPEIRTARLVENKEVQLVKGQRFVFTAARNDEEFINATNGDSNGVVVSYSNFARVLKPGNHVLVGDGLIDLLVKQVDAEAGKVVCEVLNSGAMGNNKGVNLPGVAVDLPAVTAKDVADLKFGAEVGVDFIAASFVRKASDVVTIRKILGEKGKGIKIISKIESQEGLDNFDEILSVSDGIMVARGDLGVEIPIEQVALAQKMMIHKCNSVGKIVITATQMLESMVKNPSPTRAEASDVANAVLDGTDCVMLSGETAKGLYPVLAVTVMADICREAESNINHQATSQQIRDHQLVGHVTVMEAIASSAVRATFDLNASLIIVLTETGHTARLVAKYRPRAAILAVTSSEQAARQTLVSRGVFPFLVSSLVGMDSLVTRVLGASQKLGHCGEGDLVVITSGSREAVAGATNDLKIVQVGSHHF